MDYLSAHNHNDRYYLKFLSDSYFWSVDNDGPSSGLDADLLDGTEGADIQSGITPGIIGFWYGSLSDFTGKLLTGYENWHIADGSDGSENLTDRFPIGASAPGSGYQPGSATGNRTFKPAGSVLISAHVLTVDEIMHTHTFLDYFNHYPMRDGYPYTKQSSDQGPSSWAAGDGGAYDNSIMSTVGSSQGHTHSATFAGSSANLDPPYIALIPVQFGNYVGGTWSP